MGLIKAAKETVSSLLADQWKEYFYCDSLSNDILMVKGQKKVTSKGSNKGTDNIISNGSVIAVNEGQCMIIVDQGEIVEVSAEPGVFTYDTSSEPSIFTGNLGDNLKKTFASAVDRFSFGGNTGKDQRVYFFNTKEIMNNMYGTATPIPFHLVDSNTGYSFETNVKCNGMYTFKLVDPLLFYKNVAANVSDSYNKSEIMPMMKSELILALTPSLAQIAAQGVLPSQLVGHLKEIVELVKGEMSADWTQMRGIEIVSMTMSPSFPEEDVAKINKWVDTGMLRNDAMANARKVEAMSNMFENMGNNGSSNSADAMMSMMTMNMMNNMMGGQNVQQPVQQAPVQQAAAGWTCGCGTSNTGNFCTNCGSPKPAANWTCGCGTVNTGNFCTNCGSKRA